MSSLTKEKSGTWRIKFLDGYKSKGIRLGACDKKTAQATQLYVDRLIAAKRLGTPLDSETIAWLNRLDSTIHDRIAKAGLTTSRQDTKVPTLQELMDRFKANFTGKPGTATFYGHTIRNLLEHFNNNCPLDEIDESAADEFHVWMAQTQKLSKATVARRTTACKTIFNKAVRWKMIPENPFTGITAGQQSNEARKRFIPAEDALALMEACPNAQWRLIIALSRFGGLRVPSEVLPLKWSDINWEKRSIRVTSPKTEHHAGGGTRIIPLFPELERSLMECFDEAQEGEEYIITQFQNKSLNWRTQFNRIVRKAGIQIWPKPFHNMRASRESELMREFDLATACRWLGNSPTVAARHYAVSTTENEDFRRATEHPLSGPISGPVKAQNPARQAPATTSNNPQEIHETRMDQGVLQPLADTCSNLHINNMGDTGFEPVTSCVSCMRSNQLS